MGGRDWIRTKKGLKGWVRNRGTDHLGQGTGIGRMKEWDSCKGGKMDTVVEKGTLKVKPFRV